MKTATLVLVALSLVGAAHASRRSAGCQQVDQEHKVMLRAKLGVFGVECEEMCKRLNEYPNCQCPGFAGQPATDGDTRACMDQNCQDPSQPCPTDAFVTCVKETTKVSMLQWDSLMASVDNYLGLYQKAVKKMRSDGHAESCQEQGRDHYALVQSRMALFGIECEEMCKRLGSYPDGCQCPGFAGEPATEGETRACYDQNCQDPSNPCPNDPFTTCVKETTKVSMLQWAALLQNFGTTVDLFAKGFKALHSNSTAHVKL